MATANDIIEGACRRIGVLATGTALRASEAAEALEALNDMMHGLEFEGVFLGHTDLALTDTVNLPDSHIPGIKDMLAVRIAPEYEREASPSVQQRAIDAESMLRTHYVDTMPMDLDYGLTDLPSQHWGRTR